MDRKRFWAGLLALALMLTLCVPAVRATETVPAETVEQVLAEVGKFNIIAVFDGSGSLELEGGWKTDEHGYRYDAFSIFLNLLTERGNEVGAIVFSGNQENDTSDEAMRSSMEIMELRSIESQADKDELLQKVMAVPVAKGTDAGTALLQAAEMLEGMTEKNGKPSIILLFTDGYTEVAYPAVEEQARINRDLAVQKIFENGIQLFGVFLNNNNVIKDGTEESLEVVNIVRDANGFDENADPNTQMGGMYIEVNSPDDLPLAYQRFYELLTSTKAVSFVKEKKFTIPGIGVSDVNISIIANKKTDASGRPLSSDEILETNRQVINETSLSISSPSGDWSSRDVDKIMTRGDTYLLYKIPNPEKGDWMVTVNTPDNATDLECSLIINVNISAQLELEPNEKKIPAFQSMSIGTNLFDGNARVTDPEAYEGYVCKLTLTREGTDGTVDANSMELEMDESGIFRPELLTFSELGKYSAVAEFVCGEEIRIVTAERSWEVTNKKPVADATRELVLSTGLFSKGKGKLDLTELVTDDGPLELLTIDPFCGTYNGDALDFSEEPVLKIDGSVGGNGSVRVVFTDPFGESAETELLITVKSRLVWDILILVLIVAALIAAAVAGKIVIENKKNLDGTLDFELSIPVDGGATARVRMDVRGVECKNKSIARIFEDHKDTLIDNASYEYMIGDDSRRFITGYLKQHKEVLSEIKVEVGPKKGKDDKAYYTCRITAPKNLLGKDNKYKDLSDGSVISIELDEDKNSLELEYRRGEEFEEFPDDDYGIPVDDRGNDGIEDDFEDDFED